MKLKQKVKNLSENNRIILKNTTGAFVVKGVSLLLSLFTTPAYIRYFNDNVILGVWYTLISVLTWFLNFDLGIGNGIRNNLVKAFAKNDRKEAKEIISSGVFSIGLVSLGLIVVGVVLLFSIDLNWLFNVSTNEMSYKALFLSVVCVFMAMMIRFCLTTVSSIFYALQKSAVNNFLGLCVSDLQLFFVLAFRFDSANKSIIALSVAYLVISNLPIIVAAVILFCTTLKDCRPNIKFVDKKHTKEIMNIGGVFFFCQIMYMLIANTNELLITKLFSPEYTTLYSIYYKITSLCSMIITLAMNPIWSIVTKAMIEKDFTWLNKLYKTIKLIGIGAILLQFLIVPFLQPIMNIWLRVETIQVNYVTAIAFACFGASFVYSGMLSTMVCGMSRMKLQSICYGVGVIIKFAITIIAARIFSTDWSVVVWSNALVLIPYCILQQIDLNLFFKKQLKNGIVNKTVGEEQ